MRGKENKGTEGMGQKIDLFIYRTRYIRLKDDKQKNKERIKIRNRWGTERDR